MDILKAVQDIFKNSTDYIEVKNFYYENHKCEKNGNNKKVMLDFILSNETSDDIIRLGKCSECGKVFYHKDFKSNI